MRRDQAIRLGLVVAVAVALGCSAHPGSPSSADPAAGPVSAAEEVESFPAHAEDVADYTLRARLDPVAHTIHGEGTIRFRNTSTATVHELWLHLYLNAFKNERSAFLREPAAGSRGSAPLSDWGTIDVRSLTVDDSGKAVDLWPRAELKRKTGTDADDDETDARVPLLHALQPGESLSLEVAWDDKLPSIVERTGYYGSFHMVGQWFPKLARLEPNGVWAHFPFHHLAEFYADFGTYDVTLDVPDGFTVGATGPVVTSEHRAGRLIERHLQGDIHDFAWTAWDGFRERSETIDGVAVRVLYPSGFDADAERELAAIRFSLPYFGARYGRYPYPVLTVVHPVEAAAEAGGMEYPTLITTEGPWFVPAGVNTIELVTIHEFGHQYFYGLLGSNEVLWPFLDEGVNSFAEANAMRAFLGAGSVVDLAGFTLSDDTSQAVLGDLYEHDEPVAQPAYAFTTGSHYSGLVYERTSQILETLRRVYGEPAMQRALGGYARRFRYGHPGPEDFIASFADIAGGDAAGTLRRALFDRGWVDYSVDEVVSRREVGPRGIFDRDGKRETISEAKAQEGTWGGWVLVGRRGTLNLPVKVEMRFADGSSLLVPWDGRTDSVRLPYRGKSALVAAIVDPDHEVLLDDDLRNNHASASDAPTPPANRVLERATYWAELLVQRLAP